MITPMREKRFFAQMSIYDLAQKTGIDPARISLIERGYKVPRDVEKVKIANALGAKVMDVFSEGENIK
jgi:DNA-binding XRE family transcriptional regulator